ncbi:acyl-CoA N-acyltransferase [Neohortaea acidophila]|uniref:Acyl-CoA N-acyltransferase n=1 Tax=Neohortaea acidophila TaxID=245834 RepID=A0A6A6Q1Y6_9PEZI|nr:acyl-CoA N-acyltransferase [Neohortaea acidophila]KAF2485996.1 acyl-CoA N-acyltransferase [Neohortaea acidophila]
MTSTESPVVLQTERLILRLADPYNDADAEKILSFYVNGSGGHEKLGLSNIDDVRLQHKANGPRAEYCTLAPPPVGSYFLIHLPANDSTHNGHDPADTKREGPQIGMVSMSFRPEMPWPDLGWALHAAYEGNLYATEAARAALAWWRDVIGIKEVWAGTLPNNAKSQRCAERVGFVRAGTMDIVFGDPPDESQRIKDAAAFVLPGMQWRSGLTVYPTVQHNQSLSK